MNAANNNAASNSSTFRFYGTRAAVAAWAKLLKSEIGAMIGRPVLRNGSWTVDALMTAEQRAAAMPGRAPPAARR